MIGQTKELLIIDGAQGEGGGQIFRSSLTLAMCLGQSVCIENIRAGRNKPGLLRQHMVCLQAAEKICGAKVSGAALGSTRVSFEPGAVKSGEYRFDIGSAGSTTLVFQTVLMPLLLADGVSELHITGGTHNGMAPSYDFISQCFLPTILAMGCRVDTELDKYGFYPAGGGAWRARIYPAAKVEKLLLDRPGVLMAKRAVATSARIPEHITQRELTLVQKKCLWPETALHQNLVSSCGPGNIFSLRLDMEHITEVFEAVGERNVTAERVAGRAINDLKRYLAAGVSVGEHLADQLILPLALGLGGCFTTLKPSQHLLTNIAVIKKIMPVEIKLQELAEDCWRVMVVTTKPR